MPTKSDSDQRASNDGNSAAHYRPVYACLHCNQVPCSCSESLNQQEALTAETAFGSDDDSVHSTGSSLSDGPPPLVWPSSSPASVDGSMGPTISLPQEQNNVSDAAMHRSLRLPGGHRGTSSTDGPVSTRGEHVVRGFVVPLDGGTLAATHDGGPEYAVPIETGGDNSGYELPGDQGELVTLDFAGQRPTAAAIKKFYCTRCRCVRENAEKVVSSDGGVNRFANPMYASAAGDDAQVQEVGGLYYEAQEGCTTCIRIASVAQPQQPVIEGRKFFCKSCRCVKESAEKVVSTGGRVNRVANPMYASAAGDDAQVEEVGGLYYEVQDECTRCFRIVVNDQHPQRPQHSWPRRNKGWCGFGALTAVAAALAIAGKAAPKEGCSYGWGAAAMGCNDVTTGIPATLTTPTTTPTTIVRNADGTTTTTIVHNPDGTITSTTTVRNADGTTTTTKTTKTTPTTTTTTIASTTTGTSKTATITSLTTTSGTTTTTTPTTALEELTTKFELTTEVACLPRDPFCRRDRLGRRVRKADLCAAFSSEPDNSGLVGQVRKVLGRNFARARANYVIDHQLPSGRGSNEQFAQDWYLQWHDTLQAHCENLWL